MKVKSVLIVIDEYPTSFGHTTVIKETSVRLQKIGYKVGIAAFSFKEEPPLNIEKIILDKKILFSHGDLFCTDDTSYQTYRKWIAYNKPLRFIFRRLPSTS